MKARYDWDAARRAVVHAQDEVFRAVRHLNHGKRVNVLGDIDMAILQLQVARRALESPVDARMAATGEKP